VAGWENGQGKIVLQSSPDQGKVRKFCFESGKNDFLKKNQEKLTEIT